MFRLVITFVLTLAFLSPVWAEEPLPEGQIPSEEDVQDALQAFVEWTTAFQNADYSRMWDLTDYRIQKWSNRSRWRKVLKRSVHKKGKLLSYKVTSVGPARAEKLPCIEMGHCYRKDVPVVVIIIESHYSIKQAQQQPEFFIAAQSDDGWRYGGGTFPNLPFGETGVILDQKDEARYQLDLSVIK